MNDNSADSQTVKHLAPCTPRRKTADPETAKDVTRRPTRQGTAEKPPKHQDSTTSTTTTTPLLPCSGGIQCSKGAISLPLFPPRLVGFGHVHGCSGHQCSIVQHIDMCCWDCCVTLLQNAGEGIRLHTDTVLALRRNAALPQVFWILQWTCTRAEGRKGSKCCSGELPAAGFRQCSPHDQILPAFHPLASGSEEILVAMTCPRWAVSKCLHLLPKVSSAVVPGCAQRSSQHRGVE